MIILILFTSCLVKSIAIVDKICAKKTANEKCIPSAPCKSSVNVT